MTNNKSKFHYKWTLKDAVFTKDKGTVFSCFSCGGGSTMGYKLAGFDVIGCNEIDPKMMEVYRLNHNPKFHYLESIVDFAKRETYPDELYNLDILDGSPPCSSFSMAGNRGKDWGKKKKFREGQEEQVLDTLFFDFIDLGKKLQPKVIVAENVKGLLLGDAKEYVMEIYKSFRDAGYCARHFLLDASKMGVPQRRERVFFVALRNDIAQNHLETVGLFDIKPKIDMIFSFKNINFKDVKEKNVIREKLAEVDIIHWNNANHTGRAKVNRGNTFGFFYKCMNNLPCATLTGGGTRYSIEESPDLITRKEMIKIGSFPLDYKFLEIKEQYLTGMSVPPVMTAQIATRIYDHWLK